MITCKTKVEITEVTAEFNNLLPQGLDHLGLCNVRLEIEPNSSGANECGGIYLTLTSENGETKKVFVSAFRLVDMLNDGRFL